MDCEDREQTESEKPPEPGCLRGVNESSEEEEEEEKDLCLSERPNPAKADGSLRLCQS